MTTIQHKRGTAARWLEVNPVLAEGELGLETDTLKIKFGDGTSDWISLSYFSASGGGGGSGTVTSVDMTVPTGLSITGNPITTSGTLAISLASGYSIPTTASQTNWDSAYTDRLKWDGGSTGLVAATGRTSLGATTVGSNLFTLTNPSAITFLKVNADNTVSTESAATYRTSIGATTVGSNLFTLTNPSAITFLRINADNTVTTRSAANFRADIGAGTGDGTVTTVSVASANGFAGTVANATTTPQITISTSISGLLSGNGTAISAAAVGYGDTTNPYGSKTTNYVLAGPSGGPSAAPSFRALVAADIPTLNQNTTGSAGSVANALTISSPLSGTSYNGSSAISIGLSSGYGDTQNPYASKTANYFLASPNGASGAPSFRAIVAADIPTLNQNTTGSAATLTTTRTLWGQNFNGSANVTGNLTSVGDITGSTTMAITAGTASAITLSAGSQAGTTGTGGSVTITSGNGGSTSGAGGAISIDTGTSVGIGGAISIGTSTAASVTIGRATTGTLNLYNPLLASISTVGGGGAEGGQINFARVTDGAQYWYIDSYGTSGTPSLRFVENATPQLTLATGGIATFAGAVKLRGGSTAADTAPLYFGSSTSLLSSTAAGAMEFNNKALYFTPDITPGRALVATPFYKIIATDNTTLINVSPGVPTTYSAFGTNGIALDTGVAYEVEMVLLLSATTASNSSTLVITPGSPSGAAIPSSSQLYYDYSASTTVMTNAAATSAVLRTGTTTFPALNTITIATGTTQYVKAFMKGIINIATGGNFTIRLAFTPTSPGTVTGTIYAGSYLKITPLGSEGVTDVGTWA